MGTNKIGLITIHNTVNYGSLLQTYGTYKAIESLGYDVSLIDYRCETIEKREKPTEFKDCKSLKKLYSFVRYSKELNKKYNNVRKFLNEKTKMTSTYDKNTIAKTNSDFDTFIVGSDIVWGTRITGHDYNYFLEFADDDKKKLSFSSSVGTLWDKEEQKEIKKLLDRFNYKTVREQLASQWIEQVTGYKPNVTCDPTMLWTSDEWGELADDSFVPKGKYVLIYAVNPDKRNIVEGIKYAKEHNMPVYFINFYAPVKGTKTIRPVNVSQWIALFKNADTVFTASYHGLLFSLYFHRNVFYYNRGEKSRMISLGEELKITNREGTDKTVELDEPINWSFIDAKFEEKRSFTWSELQKMLRE